jgi:hypothetical protein
LKIEKFELSHRNFKNYADELNNYLKILLQSEEMSHYENDLILCSKFLEDARLLDENFVKKFNILKMIYLGIDSQKFNLLFTPIIESEDSVFLAYKTALESFEKKDIENLLTITNNESVKIQEFQKTLINNLSVGKGAIHENHKASILDILQLYQVNRWLINQQGEILNKWFAISADTPYILGRM